MLPKDRLPPETQIRGKSSGPLNVQAPVLWLERGSFGRAEMRNLVQGSAVSAVCAPEAFYQLKGRGEIVSFTIDLFERFAFSTV